MEEKKKDKIVCVGFAVFFAVAFLILVFAPKKTYSDSERRKLAKMPELSVESVWSGRFMSGFENYAQDAFPFREQFRREKAMTAKYLFGRQDNHGIYVTDGYASAMEYPMKEASLDRAVRRFRYINETYLGTDNRVFFSVIPDKNCFLAKKSGHPSMDYEVFEEQAAKKAEFARYISISDLLELEDYYRTDTHWRQERIVDVAQRLASEMGVTLNSLYEEKTLERDFYGVYAGQSALPLKPERIRYLVNEEIENCRVYNVQSGTEGQVYDMERAMGKDPYEMFLEGSVSLLTMENPQAEEKGELILFRDSFGSSIAPLLLSGYSKITLVDIRYIHPDYLAEIVDFEGCDVLFLYSSLVLNNSETLK